MEKKNIIRLAAFGGAALLLYFAVPPILGMMPPEAQAVGSLLLLMLVNQVFIGVVGWQSNYVPGFGVWVPLLVVVLYAVSELLFYHAVSIQMEITYLETGYIAYFLRKMLLRRQAIEEKKNNKPFPRGVGRK